MKTTPFFLLIIFLVFNTNNLFAQLQNPREIPYQWSKTDTTNLNVNLSEIIVVLPRNAFPSINYPNFIDKKEGLKSFYKHEPVISVEINGKAKAYPLNMLTMHEISNDSLGGIPILPTYCPLCNSSVVYDRRLNYNGKDYLLDFEVSGMLRNSDMVMADKQTESWWQQLMGKCIVGELAGAELKVVPSLVISVEEFFTSYPDGKILSAKTGTESEESYGTNPYVNYDNEKGKPYNRFFDYGKLDTTRIAAMERVIDIEGKNGYKIYPFSAIRKKIIINDTYDNIKLVIFYKAGTVSVLDNAEIAKSKDIGSVTVFSPEVDGRMLTFANKKRVFVDNETESIWSITGKCIKGKLQGEKLKPLIYSNHFAFAWLAFHPDSEIYEE